MLPSNFKEEHLIYFIKKLLNFRKHVDKIFYSKKREKYNKESCSSDFIKWQVALMKKLYSPLLKDKQKQNWNIKFTELFIDGINYQYEAITLNMKISDFPFKYICDKQFLETK